MPLGKYTIRTSPPPKETLHPHDTGDGPRAQSAQSGSMLDTADRWEGASQRIPWRSQA